MPENLDDPIDTLPESDVAKATSLFQGTPDEREILQDAFRRLQTTVPGKGIAEAIQQNGTTIKFGMTGGEAVAQFVPPPINQITIHETHIAAGPNVLAAYLAHEGTHVQHGDKPNSIDEEYQAFKAQAEVWNQLKGNEVDEQCDAVSTIIALGEPDAKIIIRRIPAYAKLPEYASGAEVGGKW